MGDVDRDELLCCVLPTPSLPLLPHVDVKLQRSFYVGILHIYYTQVPEVGHESRGRKEGLEAKGRAEGRRHTGIKCYIPYSMRTMSDTIIFMEHVVEN